VITPVVGETIRWTSPGTGFAEWNRYAAVNDEFVPIHMDDAEGQRAGYPTAIAMGRLQWSYVHRLLRDELGDGGRIVSVSLQFRGPTLRGVGFTVSATVVATRASAHEQLVDLDVAIHDADGVLLAPGTATVAIPTQR
jgi:acyl dehydratase